jgi:hypothetical protein
MKKMYFLALCCLFTLMAWAQPTTQQDLQGAWKLITFTDAEAVIDAVKGTHALKAGVKENYDAEGFKELEGDYKRLALNYKNATLVFKDNYAEQTIGGEVFGGIFTLSDDSDVTFIEIETGDTTEEALIYIKDKMLHVMVDEDTELVYKK